MNKSDVLRVRINPDQKSLFKKIAKNKGTNVSDLICTYIENEIATSGFDDKTIESRIVATENKLEKLKHKLNKK